MYTPIHLLALYDPKEIEKYENRWQSNEGEELRQYITEKIKAGAGEDFLEWDYDQGRLCFLESMRDLKGINLHDLDITFPHGDNFEAINFSYASFYHSKFRKAMFYCNFSFAKIYNCEFHDCLFAYNGFYAANIEKVKFINCDFVEHSAFTNCVMREVDFSNCYFPVNPFIDCKFDEATRVNDPISKRNTEFHGEDFTHDKASELYKAVKEAYASGGVVHQERQYFFKERQASTRYNSKTHWEKTWGYGQELLAGYGVRPLRVLRAMLVAFAVPFAIFLTNFTVGESLLITSGALFTFGAATDSLKPLGLFYKLLYVTTSFVGLSLTALFITVLANVWFRQR